MSAVTLSARRKHFRYCLARERWHIVDFGGDSEAAFCGFTPKSGEWTYHYSFASDPEPPVRVCVPCLGQLRKDTK